MTMLSQDCWSYLILGAVPKDIKLSFQLCQPLIVLTSLDMEVLGKLSAPLPVSLSPA